MHDLTIDMTPITWRYMAPDDYTALPQDHPERPIAAVIHGEFEPPDRPWPQVHSRLVPMDGQTYIEVLSTNAPSQRKSGRGFDIRTTDDLMIAWCRIGDPDSASLKDDSDRIYDNLFHLIADQGYPHLLRIWNVIQDINLPQDGLERYRQFCIGRQDAFARQRPDLVDRYPAASALGSSEGGLCVYFIAAREPGMTIENPNQVSAFRYPPQYGPRSPSFSRALVKTWGNHASLFISGTASITGHETRHVDDLTAQVEKTIDNLETLAREASSESGKAFSLRSPGSFLKAYIRQPEDYALVRETVSRRLGTDVNMIFLRADVCRQELLVEIEGVLSV